MAGQIVGQLKFGDFLPVRPFAPTIFRPFWEPLPEKWPPAILQAISRPFFGHFWFWDCFPFCGRQAKSQAEFTKGRVYKLVRGRYVNRPLLGDDEVGPSEPIFGNGDATKHFSVKEKGFSVKGGEAIQ